jgi:hypothetical protein
MSFGLLKHFKNTKVSPLAFAPKIHYKSVILGSDLGAVLELMRVRENEGDTVRLISTRPLNKKNLQEQYEQSVSLIRSEEAVREIYRKHFNVRLSPQVKDAIFYKEGKFHEFSGRAKSMNILSGEEFFLKRGHGVELAGFFSSEEWENLDQILDENVELRIFESIENVQPSDLVNITNWEVTFKDFKTITAENIYVSFSPKKFLGYLKHKEKLSPEMIDACSSPQVQSALAVTWTLNRELYSTTETLFIPQSMTHEWGHFIVEFSPFDHKKNEQICHSLMLIHEEDPQAEDLASRIKLMKRVLERVFSHLEESIVRESIRFDDEMFVGGIKDELLEQLAFDYPSLKFAGQMSHMPQNLMNEKFLARTLLH